MIVDEMYEMREEGERAWSYPAAVSQKQIGHAVAKSG